MTQRAINVRQSPQRSCRGLISSASGLPLRCESRGSLCALPSPCSNTGPTNGTPSNSLRPRPEGSQTQFLHSYLGLCLGTGPAVPPSPFSSCAAPSLLRAEHREPPTGSGATGCPSDWFGWSHLFGFMGRLKSFVTGSPFKGTMGWALGDALDHRGLPWGCLIPLSNESRGVPPPSAPVGTESTFRRRQAGRFPAEKGFC